jgi:uncharacterized membrane protein
MDIQNTFYIFGIIYLVLNIVILLGIVIGIFFIFKTVKDIHKQVSEKLKYVEKFMHDPEEVIAEVGASVIRSAFRKAKKAFTRPPKPS